MSIITKRRELEKDGAKLPRGVVKRKIKDEIIPWLKRNEIIIITGARQTGKSVLLYQLIYDCLLPKTSNIFYFNLDISHHLDFIRNQDRIIDLVNKCKGKVYIFIDEVQRLNEPGLFLKGLYDLHLPLKIIVSGSSSIEMRSKVHEALTGRKVVFHVHPFDLEELSHVMFPKEHLTEVIKNEDNFRKLLNNYLTYGGYPAVAVEKSNKMKWHILKEIFHSYIEKDIKSFLRVENERAFVNLVKILASQIGNLVNKDELSNTLGIHKHTLENYLFYLEQTFILDFVKPFYKNPRKELLKSPKVYFNDLGIRNFAIASFGEFEFRVDKGSLFENLFYLCLKEKMGTTIPIHFWRTKAGAEVDFVILQGLKPIPFEVKATNLNELKISKSLRSFLQDYQPSRAYYFNLSLKGKTKIEKTTISFFRPQDLVSEKFVYFQKHA